MQRYFYVIGLNYQKADAEIRGNFSISESAQKAILVQAREEEIPSVCVISTCNRTELYGFVHEPIELIKLLCEHTHGTLEEFEEVAYVYRDQEAVSHVFRVATGLDSQILGDLPHQLSVSKDWREIFENNTRFGKIRDVANGLSYFFHKLPLLRIQ